MIAADAFCAAPASVEISPMVGKSTFLSPVADDQQISVVLTLPLSDPAGAASFVQHVSQRGDPLFHQYLTPQEFAARYGANPDDYAALKEWATANGLTISQESIARTCLTVRGTVSQFQTLFNTQINNYRSPAGDQFYSASSKLTVPSAIASKISGIVGLTSSKHSAPLVTVGKTLGENPAEAATPENKTADSGTGPGGSYSPADLQRAYFFPTFGNLDKTAVVAVFEQGGFTESDVLKFLDKNKLPHRKVTPVSVNGSPTTVVTSDLRIELEAVLDIDMVIGTNPDVSEVRVYEDSVDPFPVALLDALNQVADDKVGEILSISYGADEAAQGDAAMNAEQTAIMELAGLGITVTASSGDKGAYGDGTLDDYNVSDPASQPYVTGVGGGLAAQLLISGLGSGAAPGPLPAPKVTPGTTTAVVKWTAATAAAAYAVTVQTPGYVLNDVKTYLTKATSMKLTDLVPHDSNYQVTVWAFNANGFTYGSTDFTTK